MVKKCCLMNMHICVCKWGPPLSKNKISAIYGKLCMIISWNWCLHICFHGQGLSYYHLKCCSIICILCVCKWGPPLSKNKFSSICGNLCMIIIIKMVSTDMCTWSRINMMSLKMSYCEYILCVYAQVSCIIITSFLGCIGTLWRVPVWMS